MHPHFPKNWLPRNPNTQCHYVLWKLMKHQTIQAEQVNISGSLAQPPAHSRASSRVRPGCSGLCSVGSQQPDGQRPHSLPGQPVPLLDHPQGGEVSPFIQLEPAPFQFMRIVSHSRATKASTAPS